MSEYDYGHTSVISNKSIDFDPALGRFLSPDPVVQAPDDTQSFNRYSYCLNNPLRYTDPTGLKWLMSKFGNEYFFFYDKRVDNVTDLFSNYKNHSDITILDDAIVTIRDKETGNIIDEFELFPDGSFTMNGDIQTQEYNNNGLLLIGNTILTNSKTISNNYHGSYLGSRNPKLTDGAYSYAVPPSDLHDYFAFQHDLDYDKVGAQGKWDALFNSDTLLADMKFVSNMKQNMGFSCWGWPAYKAFELISYWKMIYFDINIINSFYK